MTVAAAAADIGEAKRALRALAGERRRAARAADAFAGETVARNFLDAILPACPPGCAVSGYWPMDAELDVRPLLAALHDRGHDCCLPVVTGRDRPLLFRAWSPGGRLVPAAFGTMVPADDAPEIVPRVVLAPLLAFDDRGYRLGWGGGHYDRTLAALRAGAAPVLAVGVGFAAQRIGRVPAGPHDQRLDWVVTERGATEVP
jgi:5-formyltetrahydrofolate cyclo-ligase